nr:MAG TPA: hypothetical protein [Caudoviricetes sp.]
MLSIVMAAYMVDVVKKRLGRIVLVITAILLVYVTSADCLPMVRRPKTHELTHRRKH